MWKHTKLFNSYNLICFVERQPSFWKMLAIRSLSDHWPKIQVIQRVFECSVPAAACILNKHKKLHEVDELKLECSAEILDRFSISKDNLSDHVNVLLLIPTKIESRARFLKEAGFQKVDCYAILRFHQLVNKRIALIKAYGYLPPDANVVNSYLSTLKQLPESTPPFVFPFSQDDSSLLDVQSSILSYFLQWEMDASHDELHTLVKVNRKFQYRSLFLMQKMIYLLLNEMKFTKEKIKRYGYLLYGHPDNLLNTLKAVPKLAGVDIKEILTKFPKLVIVPTENIISISKMLKEHNIPDASIRKCFEIFTLSPEGVHQRLEQFHMIPELEVLKTHPRMLQLLHYQKKARFRLDYLQDVNIKCVSLNILCNSKEIFQKYATEGLDRTRGLDVVIFLADALNCTEQEIRHHLHKHPFWRSVPLINIKETLDFLISEGYTHQQIYNDLCILLYTKDEVMRILEELVHYTDLHCLIVKETNQTIAESRNHQLSLCLYYLEVNHHFTGNGVWHMNREENSVAKKAISD